MTSAHSTVRLPDRNPKSLQERRAWWKRHLAEVPALLSLPQDRQREPIHRHECARIPLRLPTQLTKALQESARREGTTLLAALLCGWAATLARWSGQNEVIVGFTAGSLGDSTLPLRFTLSPDTSVGQLLSSADRLIAEARENADVPLGNIIEDLGLPKNPGHHPLFQTQVVLPADASSGKSAPESTPFDLTLSLQETNGEWQGALDFISDAYTASTMVRLLDSWIVLLEAFKTNSRREIERLPILSEHERERVLYHLNNTAASYPQNRLVHELFEEQVRRSPTAIALAHDSQRLTYAELNAKANQLARFLINEGVGYGTLVAICVERSSAMVIGLLAILKAGGAYVPLDPNYPPERLRYMLEDAAPRLVLTQQELISFLPSTTAAVVCLDQQLRNTAGHIDQNICAAELGLNDSDRVYVIYTSGSTGRPKGTEMSHRAVVNLLQWHFETFGSSAGQHVAQFAALSFDVAFQEIFSTLCSGGTLVLLNEWIRRDARSLTELLIDAPVHRLFLPPLMLQALAEFSASSGVFPHAIRDIITAGEQLRITREIIALFERLNGARLHNHYGPTETHVVTALTLAGDPRRWPPLPSIGRPIANTHIYVLDQHLQPVPVGVTGELYIGGAGLASGYLGRPDLTRQRFIADPYSVDPTARLYKTGDLGRWHSDGTLEYLGRNDDQVKIRGFRIELPEIEAQLARCSGVKDAVVVAREDVPGIRRLIAYCTARGSSGEPGLTVEDIRSHLHSTLPDYMIPSAFVLLETLPKTPSGKLDRRALPAPGAEAHVNRSYEAPRGETESVLAALWQSLLRLERVGRYDNFFELGGDSLGMVQLLERLRRQGLTAEVRSLFGSRTLAEMAGSLTQANTRAIEIPPNLIPPECERITPAMLPLVDLEPEHIERIIGTVPGGAANIQDIYPLAPLQEGILFHHLLNPNGADTYVLPTLLSVESFERLQSLIDALQRIVDRHDALRSAVIWEMLPRPVQVVYRRAFLPVSQLGLQPDREVLEQMQERMKPEFQKLDLRVAPLMQLSIAADRRGTRWYALLQMHHLICDHQSLEMVLGEVRACLKGLKTQLPPALGYRAHVAQVLEHAGKNDAEQFFRSKLAEVDEPTAPFGLADVHGDGTQIEEYEDQLDPQLSRRIRSQARLNSVSAATLFHAGWGLVVSRTTGREDVVYGTLLLGRLQGEAGAQPILGMFINTLPLRLKLRDTTIREFVHQTHSELIELLNHEQASLAIAQRSSGLSSGVPLFSTLLNYRHRPARNETDPHVLAPGVEIVGSSRRTNYPITASIDDREESFSITMQTDRRIDPRQLTEYLRTALTSVVEALENAGDTPTLRLPILPATERRRILHDFNAPQRSYSQTKVAHQLFEDQVRSRPGAVALVYDGRQMTYSQLNERANQLSGYLRDCGVRPDERVAICVERGFEMIVAILGVLKAGGAYVPLDPNYPPARLSYILRDASPQIALTLERFKDRLGGAVKKVTTLDTDWPQIATHSSENPDPTGIGLAPHHLAYIIYTSGSTGDPKGVMIEHANVTRLFAATEHWFNFGPSDVWTLFHSFAFDFSVWELWGALLYGGRLVIVPYLISRSPQEFYRLVCEEHVTILNQTPSAFAQLIDAQARSAGEPHSLRFVIFGGEALELHTLQPWVQRNGAQQPTLVNMYGITETTVHVTYHALSEAEILTGRGGVVGKPIPDLQVYLLDACQQPAPIGVPAEIYVGGAGVARGYLGRPELTAQRFVRDPLTGARLYRSGDLGRWRPDGKLEHLGRNDTQVKIRGHRIELGEIEAQLSKHPLLREVAVLAREEGPGEKRLVAYITAAGDRQIAIDDLRAHLRTTLPEYMVPSAFVRLERLPLTSNGKLDRRALPAPELPAYSSREYEPPQSEIEEILTAIWEDLLRVKRVGRRDNFFELGGHSLLIVQLIERLRRVGLTTEVRSVFESPTLAALAKRLTRGTLQEAAVPPNAIPPDCNEITPRMLPLVTLEPQHIERIAQSVPGGMGNIQDIYPLAPLQEGILFHHLMNEHAGDTYVLPTLIALADRNKLDELVAALQRVIDRHDVLRTAVLWNDLPRPVQVVYRRAPLMVEQVTLDVNRDPVEQMKERMKPDSQKLNLRRAPLMRLQVAPDRRDPRWYALLQLHHLTTDHMAQEIVIAEVGAYLEERGQDLPDSMPYRNHVAQALAHARTHDAEAFFRSKLSDIDEPTAPFGVLDVHGNGTRIEEHRQSLPSELAARLRTRARRLGVSAATLFHAAWALVVSHTSTRTDVVFGSVLLGRLQVSAGAQRILGMFINTLPLRLRVEGVTTKELIEQTQRELVELLNQEQSSLATAQRCSGITGAAPLFTSLLNFRHSVADPQGEQQITAAGVKVIASDEWTNYPITVSIDDTEEGFALTASTDRRIDPRRITGYLTTALESLADALEKAPQTRALELRILPDDEATELLERFNDTRTPYPEDKLVHHLFEEQARGNPTAIAAEHGERRMSYAELDTRADRLAARLREEGVGPDDIVAICFQRSPEMLVGLLATLKAGAAYLPLDPSHPPERLQQMLEDATPKAILTQSSLSGQIPGQHARRLTLESLEDASAGELSPTTAVATETVLHPDRLVYVIYTSGSTGRPKGTAMSHRSMSNLIEWHRRSGLDASGQRVLQFAALSFDVAFQEIFSTLCTGGTLVLLDEWVRKEPSALMQLLSERSIQRLFVPPLMLQSLAEYSKATRTLPTALRDIIVAGEQLRISPEIVSFFQSLNQCQLHNHYGPTETHVVTSLTLAGSPDPWPALPSIGRPIANTRICILDNERRLAPLGVAGEIYIGGACLANGYLNRAELTEQRFIPDPLRDDPLPATLYKTGDLGRWLADGTLEYLGRNDQQVKLRGYRIELGEIEVQLAKHPQIREAAVVLREDVPGDKQLVAYVTTRQNTVPQTQDLRVHLRTVLPEYMIPSAFVVLEALPLTPTGKLNRRALPAPTTDSYTARQYEPPQGELEELVGGIWRELLRADRVGRNDSFFELGGHSLLAMQAMVRIRSALTIDLPIRMLFENPTLQQFSVKVDEAREQQLLNDIARGEADIQQLLETVTSLSESRVRELMQELSSRGTP